MFIASPSLLLLLVIVISLAFPSTIQAYSLFDFGSRDNKPTSSNNELEQQQPQSRHEKRESRNHDNKLHHQLQYEDDEGYDDNVSLENTSRNNPKHKNPTSHQHRSLLPRLSTEESTLSTGLFHTCAIIYRAGVNQDDACGGKTSLSSSSAAAACGPAKCWGQNNFGQSSPPPGVMFRQLSSGGFFTCGLKVDGAVACWGDIDHPPKSLQLLSSEERSRVEHARRMRQNEEGREGGGGTGRYVNGGGHHNVQVSSGLKHACAVTLDSEVHCWGRNDYGESSPPSGKFIQVSIDGAGKDFVLYCPYVWVAHIP